MDGIEEARAYYNHPVLRDRLIEITKALLEHRGKLAQDILPSVDARKVKSCMTLFWLVSENPLFKSVIEAFYDGQLDKKTMEKCKTTITKPSNLESRDSMENIPTIEINTEIMVEINNLCHFNEVYKVQTMIRYMIPKWYMDSKNENSCICLRHIYLKHSPDPYSSVVYNGLPKDMVLFCWKEKGNLQGVCYVSVVEEANFREAFRVDFEGMDDQDCDPDELGWYYFIDKDLNLNNIVNYSGTEYVLVFRIIDGAIFCSKPPVIRHKYRLRALNKTHDDDVIVQKYYDLYHSGNWNAKHAIERGGFNLNR